MPALLAALFLAQWASPDAALAETVPAGALNVRDYGGKGDGSTNDRHAIQRAIAAGR